MDGSQDIILPRSFPTVWLVGPRTSCNKCLSHLITYDFVIIQVGKWFDENRSAFLSSMVAVAVQISDNVSSVRLSYCVDASPNFLGRFITHMIGPQAIEEIVPIPRSTSFSIVFLSTNLLGGPARRLCFQPLQSFLYPILIHWLSMVSTIFGAWQQARCQKPGETRRSSNLKFENAYCIFSMHSHTWCTNHEALWPA